METEIYYFSGTGNSLHVAKELQKRLGDCSIIPIAGLLKQKTIQTNGKAIGIVFPVHALTIPIAVHKFLKKANVKQAEYIFAAATRLGTTFSGFSRMNRVLGRQGKKLDAQILLNMGNNECRHTGYTTPTAEELAELESAVQTKLDMFASAIKERRTFREEDTEYTVPLPYKNGAANRLYDRFITGCVLLAEYTGGVQYFCADEKCNGCGICEKVCLSQKIRMEGKKPVWEKKVLCYMCFACLNYCPKQAVQINDIPGVPSITRECGRYPHPYATISDIAGQKQA